MQVGNFISYGVCKFAFLGSPLGHPKGVPCAELSPQVTEGLPATTANRFHKELRFFFSLLKRKKEAKKEKSSRFTCTTRSSITRRLHAAKIPRRGKQAAAAAVTLPFLHLKLGRKVSGDSPLSLLKRKKEVKKEKSSRSTCTTRSNITRRLHVAKIPRRGEQAAAAAVTLPFLLLKLGRRVGGDPPRKDMIIMITVSNVSLQFGGDTLFKNVDLQFNPGNCYGVIGANGAGKSTFLKILCGQLKPTTGEVTIPKNLRMSVLKQDHFAYDAYTVLNTIIMGNQRLYDIMQQKDALYAKEDFTEEDGILASELEAEFAELDGWEAESNASKLIQGLGLPEELLYQQMADLSGNEKVKVLLAQALFGNPDIILMDEPTNHLDIDAIAWLEDFLSEYFGTVIVVSHDRHFLNDVCTHIVDIDYTKIKMYVGNYEFWYESSQMMQRLIKQQNKKVEDKIAELKTFIARFSANKSKSKQATSRRKLLDNLTVEELPASSRRYPFIGFDMDRELGKEVLQVSGISKTVDGVKLLNNVSFTLGRTDKVAFIGESEQAITMLFKILMEEEQPDEGTFKWGVSASTSYFPVDNSAYFNDNDDSILDWIRQYSTSDETETFLRGFLGRMLFSGDDIYKPVKVLSGGEKVRCMFARMMLFHSNVLLLDRPTNHLDLESITAVNNGLVNFKGVVILSSHDHEILETVANRIIEITPEGCIDRQGTYEEYLEWKKENGK